MADLKCDECKGAMKKTKDLMMSNSKFEVHECTRCGEEKKICLGVAGR